MPQRPCIWNRVSTPEVSAVPARESNVRQGLTVKYHPRAVE
jgi:hypothetical protein